MVDFLTRNWWVVALRGLFAVVFGIMAFVWPGMTMAVLVLLFGAYVLADGVFAMIAAISAPKYGASRWPHLAEGITGIVAGGLTLAWPGITALVLLYLVAAWAIVTGVAEIAAAVALRRAISGEWLLGLAGLASILLGLVLVASPGTGALAVVWLIGIYAVTFGVALMVLGFRMRGLAAEIAGPDQQPSTV